MATPSSSLQAQDANYPVSCDVPLPVARPTKIRKSKSGRRRAAVLILVHVLIALHIVHWLQTGRTLTPLEPSEAMEFSKHNVINAGLIFFALTILSTLVFGRWFCGWGCHLVALQDLSRWILGKLNIKPKPARMGILAIVPLIAFVYMFIAPVVFRATHELADEAPALQLTTDSFWSTFPGWIPAVLTFLACGFAIIYLLGSKGFCTFGCPYGAIFGIADQLAPARIRVTDACRGCGHCTAVCSSNVRVHEEVRDFGMVVDPGCMKCQDCVSVCPNDALYFGFGPPAVLAPRRSGLPRPDQAGKGWSGSLPRWILTGGFIFAALSLSMWYDDDFDWRTVGMLTAGTLAVAVLFKGKSRRLRAYSFSEEALLCVVFLAAMFAFRGLYGAVPFLFCLGIAAIAAYLGLEFFRLAYRSDLSIHHWQLKRRGRLAGLGYTFAAFMLVLGGFGVRSGLAQYDLNVKQRLAHRYFAEGVALGGQDRFAEAIDNFERSIAWRPDFIAAQENLAGMYCAVGSYEKGIELYRQSLRRNPDDAGTHLFLAKAYLATHRTTEAEEQLRRAIELAPQWPEPQVLWNELRALQAGEVNISIEQEVRRQVLDQPIGSHTVAALDLPEDFLQRVVGRIIRSSYQQRYHMVVRDDQATTTPGEEGTTLDEAENVPPADSLQKRFINIRRSTLPESILEYRRSMSEARPALRGFRAPILGNKSDSAQMDELQASAPPEIRQAADVVARRLAGDGLLATLAMAIKRIGPSQFVDQPTSRDSVDLLRSIGLPVDLLKFFPPSDQSPADPYAIVAHVARLVAEGMEPQVLRLELDKVPFQFTKSRDDFRVATESGEHDIGLIRLQMTRGTYWRGIGAGGSIDVARQLVSQLPEASFVVSIEEKYLESFRSIARGWPLVREGQLTISPEAMPVAQWAQDNGKAGLVRSEQSGNSVAATVVPRYASRREDGSVFIPGETFLADGLAGTGHVVIQSPLLFQGGNLLAARDPQNGRRILIIGEAEIYRNTALGLTRAQALEAFQSEFGVDHCVVLPAISFHVDFDVSLRAHGGRLVAFVNDSDRAVRIVLGLGVDALAAHGTIDSSTAQQAKAHLRSGKDHEFLSLVLDPVRRRADPNGRYPLSLAEFFSASPVDSPVGNFQRFLLALDTLASSALTENELPDHRHLRACLRSFRRRQRERQVFHEQLSRLGWKVVAVPSLAEGDRSINYLNGVHARQKYIMPAYGGFYAPLDEAAGGVFEAELRGVAVVPILCGESQRRVGALHCSVSAYPQP